MNRNAQIVEARTAGKTMAQLGREFHLSRERVRQILARESPDKLGAIYCQGCAERVLRTRDVYCQSCQNNLRVYGTCVPDVRFGDGDAYRALNFWRHVEHREGHMIWLGEFYSHKASPKPTSEVCGEQMPHRIAWRLTNGRVIDQRDRLYRTCEDPRCIAPDHRRIHRIPDCNPIGRPVRRSGVENTDADLSSCYRHGPHAG